MVLLWSAWFMLILSTALVFHLREEKPYLSCILLLDQGLGYNGSGSSASVRGHLQLFCSLSPEKTISPSSYKHVLFPGFIFLWSGKEQGETLLHILP